MKKLVLILVLVVGLLIYTDNLDVIKKVNISDAKLSYGIKVRPLPRTYNAYVGVVLTASPNANETVLAIKRFNVPVIVVFDNETIDTVKSVVSTDYNVPVSAGYFVSNAQYDQIKEEIDSIESNYSISISALVTRGDLLTEDHVRFGANRNIPVLVLSSKTGYSFGQVGEYTVDTVVFDVIYYDNITEIDAPVIRARIKDMLLEGQGVMLFGTSVLTFSGEDAETAISAFAGTINEMSKDINFFNGDINKVSTFLLHYKDVVDQLKVEGAITSDENEYGKRVIIHMKKWYEDVSIVIPRTMGGLNSYTLTSITIYSGDKKVTSYDVVMTESERIIYPLKDMENVKIYVFYSTNEG